MDWWQLSLTDPTAPEGEQLVGFATVELDWPEEHRHHHDGVTAVRVEALIMGPVPDDVVAAIPEGLRRRVLRTRAECEACDVVWPYEDRDSLDDPRPEPEAESPRGDIFAEMFDAFDVLAEIPEIPAGSGNVEVWSPTFAGEPLTVDAPLPPMFFPTWTDYEGIRVGQRYEVRCSDCCHAVAFTATLAEMVMDADAPERLDALVFDNGTRVFGLGGGVALVPVGEQG